MTQENLKSWRLHVLDLLNMIMHYPFVTKAVRETIAKPSQAKPSHMQTSELLGVLNTVFVKVVRVM